MLIAALSILLASCQKEIDRQNSSVSSSVLESNEKIGNEGMVYTLSNQVSENKVLAYSRDASGHLTFLKAYSTGEKGTGAGLGSQEAVILSRNNEWLLAVNAGSNSVSSFKISRNNLQLISTVSSQGTTPISVTEHNNIVYVLNAGGSGNISGFTLDQSGNLKPIANSVRPLSSTSASPAQISFTTNGKAVVVTEKATNKIITYTINSDGIPGIMHSISSSTPIPFGFAVANNSYIYVSQAAGTPNASTVSSYYVKDDGSISLVDGSVGAGQTSACWVVLTNNGKYIFTTNAGSGSISSFKTNHSGDIAVLNAVAAATGTNSSPIDAALSNNSKFLYVLTSGNQAISAFAVGNDGSLGRVQVETGLQIGTSGLAAK